ncbi:hypothetical protein N2603_38685 [Bradyrhizobium huanghuaihaiense]|uniref:hypothetical protein n=1 Tax=Bradyrhizobium huanghuaihaiense TaxID=990078 RepID=UPI0021AAF9E2|nr:hypothetical protein [Bradyrhizobium sp. CB3035]UWU75829.1 hypothetical protein N2603_38685 [Bradyrhizobium sp. CB3035]
MRLREQRAIACVDRSIQSNVPSAYLLALRCRAFLRPTERSRAAQLTSHYERRPKDKTKLEVPAQITEALAPGPAAQRMTIDCVVFNFSIDLKGQAALSQEPLPD